jgi:hypothetical protein
VCSADTALWYRGAVSLYLNIGWSDCPVGKKQAWVEVNETTESYYKSSGSDESRWPSTFTLCSGPVALLLTARSLCWAFVSLDIQTMHPAASLGRSNIGPT